MNLLRVAWLVVGLGILTVLEVAFVDNVWLGYLFLFVLFFFTGVLINRAIKQSRRY